MRHAEMISFTPSAPPRLMICSSAGIIDFAAVEAEALGAGELESQNLSKPSASISLLRIARLPSRVKVISLSGALDALLDPALLRRVRRCA